MKGIYLAQKIRENTGIAHDFAIFNSCIGDAPKRHMHKLQEIFAHPVNYRRINSDKPEIIMKSCDTFKQFTYNY